MSPNLRYILHQRNRLLSPAPSSLSTAAGRYDDLRVKFMNHSIFDQFYKIGIIPVLEIDTMEHAAPLAEALLTGRLPVAEVTLRTEAALDSIRVIARNVPEVI